MCVVGVSNCVRFELRSFLRANLYICVFLHDFESERVSVLCMRVHVCVQCVPLYWLCTHSRNDSSKLALHNTQHAHVHTIQQASPVPKREAPLLYPLICARLTQVCAWLCVLAVFDCFERAVCSM